MLAFLVSPLMTPGLVVGVALLQALREIGLRDVPGALIVGHIVITLPYITLTVHASLSLFDITLIDAARTLGLSYPRAIIKVMVPGLAPAFLTAGLFAFLASLDNYPISIFLTDARNKTLPIEILRYLEETPDPTIAAISTCLILLTIIVLFVAERLVGVKRLAQFWAALDQAGSSSLHTVVSIKQPAIRALQYLPSLRECATVVSAKVAHALSQLGPLAAL